MKKVLLVGLLGLTLFACKKEDDVAIPECIQNRLATFEGETCSSGASLKSYMFNGARVFVFNPGACGADLTSEVRDEGCAVLGFLGGISGNTEINGVDFQQSATQETLIWVN